MLQPLFKKMNPSSKVVLVVHGGAWSIPDHLVDASRSGVKDAALRGYQCLVGGGTAIDAVETAVRVMEDDPVFLAGTGSSMDIHGNVTMDALMMEGTNLTAGAVACVKNLANPVTLARMVMEKTEHVLLVGEGADVFAKDMGIKETPKEELVTDEAREELKKYLKYHDTIEQAFPNREPGSSHDTVGAVALDIDGRVAFATSTGGIAARRLGRVGDSPLIGCGGYCDDSVGAISSTGHGESIARVCLAHRISMLMEQGHPVDESARLAFNHMTKRTNGGAGGVVIVSKDGVIGRYNTTKRMAWASMAENNIVKYGIDATEEIIEEVQS